MKEARASNLLFDNMVRYMKHRWYDEGAAKDDLIAETAEKFNVVQGFAEAILGLIRTQH